MLIELHCLSDVLRVHCSLTYTPHPISVQKFVLFHAFGPRASGDQCVCVGGGVSRYGQMCTAYHNGHPVCKYV